MELCLTITLPRATRVLDAAPPGRFQRGAKSSLSPSKK
jgi:hypothetical protein